MEPIDDIFSPSLKPSSEEEEYYTKLFADALPFGGIYFDEASLVSSDEDSDNELDNNSSNRSLQSLYPLNYIYSGKPRYAEDEDPAIAPATFPHILRAWLPGEEDMEVATWRTRDFLVASGNTFQNIDRKCRRHLPANPVHCPHPECHFCCPHQHSYDKNGFCNYGSYWAWALRKITLVRLSPHEEIHEGIGSQYIVYDREEADFLLTWYRKGPFAVNINGEATILSPDTEFPSVDYRRLVIYPSQEGPSYGVVYVPLVPNLKGIIRKLPLEIMNSRMITRTDPSLGITEAVADNLNDIFAETNDPLFWSMTVHLKSNGRY